MSQITLKVIKDAYGHYPTGANKTYEADELRPLAYGWIVDADVPNLATGCEGKFLARAGQQGGNTLAIPSTRVLQIAFRGQHIYVQAIKQKIYDAQKGCCLTGAQPVVSLAVDIATPAFGATVTFTATATDTEGVAKVEFWDGADKLGEDAATPFTLATAALAKGTHFVVARVIDTDGQTAYSAQVRVSVS
jgi:hypothetical protein